MSDSLRRLIIIFFILQSVSLQIVPLWGSSEAREAHVVWEVANTDNKILPTRAGIIPSKPPMFHWISGAIYSLFEWAQPLTVARFVSLVGSIIFLFFSFRLTGLLGDATGVSLIVILSSWLFIAQSTDAKVDMLFGSFLVGSFYFSSSLILNKLFELKKWLAAVLLLVLAVLCKGPLAIALSGLLLSMMILLCPKDNNYKSTISWLICLIISLSIVGIISSIWYLTAANLGGEAFISRQLLFENLHRIIGHQKMNTQPWWFYVPSLLRTIFPWSLLALFIVCNKSYRNQLNAYGRLSLIIFCVGIIALSIASGKRHSYPLPLLPFLAAAIAPALNQLFSEQKLTRITHIVLPIIILISCIGLTIKGVNKNYKNLASEIVKVSNNKKITILKDVFDESLDPIMYFLRENLSEVNTVTENENMCLITDSHEIFNAINSNYSSSVILKNENYILVPCTVVKQFTTIPA